MGYWLLVPLLPNVAHDLRLRPDTLGLIWGVGPTIAAILQLPTGLAADRFGRRRVLMVGLVTMAAGMLLRAASVSVPVFGLSQFMLGLTGPLLITASFSAVADAYSTGARVRALGLVQAGFSLGQVIGNLLGGVVGTAVGWRLLSLIAVALPAALVLPVLLMKESPSHAQPAGLGSAFGGLLRFITRPAALAIGGFTLLGILSLFAASYLLPFLVTSRGLTPSVASLLLVPFLGGAIVGAPAAGALAQRVGMAVPLVGAIVAGVAGMVAVAAFPAGLAALAVCYLAFGVAASTVSSFAAALFSELAVTSGGAGVGSAVGGSRFGQAIGMASSSPTGGTLYVHGGVSGAFYGLSAVLVLALALAVVATRPRHTGSSS
jgi:predicted MFS family arabinose efflux permease